MITIALIAIFAITFVAVQVLRESHLFYAALPPAMDSSVRDLSIINDPISSYLTGPYGWFLDAGFVALAAALWLFVLGSPLLAAWGFAVGGIGVLGAMLTKRIPTMLGQNIDGKPWEPIHLVCAALGFVGTWAAELAFSFHYHLQVGFLIAAFQAILALVFLHLHSTKTAVLEKVEIVLILVWLSLTVLTH